MVNLKRSQIRTIEEAMALPQGFGYVLDFSDRTISEFFEDEFGIDIDHAKYAANGTSKRVRLSTFISIEDGALVARVLRSLWERREALISRGTSTIGIPQISEKEFFDIIKYIEGGSDVLKTDALEAFISERTLNELIRDIERDLAANRPEGAMDHLHTYCMKKFAHLLKIRGIECTTNEALHARVGKYREALSKERPLTKFTDRALKSTISLFDAFNNIRNHHSFAHDNEILDAGEARYVFEQMRAMLIFIRGVEAGRYDQ